jgi:dynein heavy chain
LITFETLWYEEWCKAVRTARDGLLATLLVRHPTTGELIVNFDDYLFMLIREVHCLERMGFAIPDAASSVYNQQERLKMYSENLKYIVKEYYRIINMQDDIYKKLMKPMIDRVNAIVELGTNSLSWMSLNIDNYISTVFEALAMVEETIAKANDIIKFRLTANCDGISRISLIAFTNEVRTIKQFLSDQEKYTKHIAKEIDIKNQEMESGTNDLIKLITYKYSQEELALIEGDIEDLKTANEEKMLDVVVSCLRTSVRLLKDRISGQDDQQKKQRLAQEKPIFSAQLKLQIPEIRLFPSLEDVQKCVNRCARIMLESTKYIYHWNRSKNECKSIYNVVGQNKTTIKRFLQLTGAMGSLSDKINSFILRFRDYHFLWKDDRNEEIQVFVASKPSLQQYEAKIHYFSQIEKQLDEMQQFHKLGSLLLDLKPIKLALKTEAQQWKYKYGQAANAVVKRKMDKLISFIDDTTNSLSREATDLEGVNQTMLVLEKMRIEEGKIHAKLKPIEDTYAVLAQYGIKITKEEQEQVEDDGIAYRWQQLVKLSRDTMDYLRQVGPDFKKDLLDKVKLFERDVREFKMQYDANGPNAKGIKPGEAQARLKAFQSAFDERQRKWQTYSMGERLFGLPETQYPDLTRIEKELGLLAKLYDLYSDVTITVSGFEDIIWSEINVPEMENVLASFQVRVRSMPIGLRKWDAFLELKQLVDNFFNTLPLLSLLSNPAVKDRHWRKIAELCGKDLDYRNPEFKVKNLIDAKLVDHKEDIEEICNAAAREQDIEEKMKGIDEEWKSKTVIIGSFKDRGNVVLKDTAELMTSIEESQVTLSTLLGNIYNEHFRKDIQLWMQKLSTTQSVIDDWLKVQSLWVYMEAVLTGGDIARELPNIARKFNTVDRSWIKIMSTAETDPKIIKLCYTDESLREMLPHLKETLEYCQKSLSGYLETKRMIFPRFYFISDTQLLEILGQGSDADTIQKHLISLFAAISRVEFDPKEKNHIIGMYSGEGEYVPFSDPVICQDNIENWLNKIVAEMSESLNDIIRNMSASVINELTTADKMRLVKFIDSYPSQVSLLGLQMFWTYESEMALRKTSRSEKGMMQATKKKFELILSHLVGLTTNSKLTYLERTRIETLITIHIHQVEIFQGLVRKKGKALSPGDFDWLKQTRFYWKSEKDRCIVSITDSDFEYCNEYLGCTDRLVITPLTDRIYISCAQAMGMFLGGAPAGPAGTGKTETTKDMGRTIGKYFITINCSDQMGYISMGMLFKGIAQGGVWCGFDEVNRVELEVLSVVASQIKCVFDAMKFRKPKFVFTDGTSLSLDPKCAIFITMNPGYAGRTELPENMKALFRTIAVVVPNRRIIMQVKLASAGFQENNVLSKKFYVLYQLCEEQLSNQNHYDFGLRNILSVLRTCGRTLRENPNQSEVKVLMRVLRDMNSSKLVDEDGILFKELLNDLFPNETIEEDSYSDLQKGISAAVKKFHLVDHPDWNRKVIELYEQYKVRHGLCIMGPSGAGKSTCIRVLAESLTAVEPIPTKILKMNPKAITANQMFGILDPNNNDWVDGIFSALWKGVMRGETEGKKENSWILLDGPVDALWIENLNTVLDDTRSLTLASGDRLSMPKSLKLVLEVGNLDNASPATVSRVGMVYIGGTCLGWSPVFKAWQKKHESKPQRLHQILEKLFDMHTNSILGFMDLNCEKKMPYTDTNLVASTLKVLDGLFLSHTNWSNMSDKHIERLFIFSIIWGVGSLFELKDRQKLHQHMAERRLDLPIIQDSTSTDTVYEYVVEDNGDWQHWRSRVPNWKYPSDSVPQFNSILVPTVDSVRSAYLIDLLAKQKYGVLLIGENGTAKTVTIQEYLRGLDSTKYKTKFMSFSSATTPELVQTAIFTALEKRITNVYGPPPNRYMNIFIDDISMPEINEWGDQITNELLRQVIEDGGFYTLEHGNAGVWFSIVDVQFFAAMNQPGGGRNDIPERLKRHFSVFNVTFPSTKSIDHIFGTICEGHFCKQRGFVDDVMQTAKSIPALTRHLWTITKQKMLPTPSNFHYIFNLRDLSRIFQGMLQATSEVIKSSYHLLSLWKHECERVLQDKFSVEKDRSWFANSIKTLLKEEYNEDIAQKVMKPKFFVDFMRDAIIPDQSQIDEEADVDEGEIKIPKVYEPIPSFEELNTRLISYMDEYNEVNKKDPMNLVLFEFAMVHLMRISRIIRMERGNALLVGVGGSGKQSLTRLAAYIAGYITIKLQITKTYGVNNLLDELRKIFRSAVLAKPVVFLFTDNDIKDEGFLEYINMILTSGEIPNLFAKDEREAILEELRPIATHLNPGLMLTQENLYKFFIDRARNNLHVVLCFSPVGDQFRTRARKFPGLISGCTIDWFPAWPIEALHATADRFIADVPIVGTPKQKKELVNYMCQVHENVVELTKEYFNKYRRNTYVTPKSYLSFIEMYKSIYEQKHTEIKSLADKVKNGLNKLHEAGKGVAVMKEELARKEKQLAVAQSNAILLLEKVSKQKMIAEEKTNEVKRKSDLLEKEAEEITKDKEEAEKELTEARPALIEAEEAVNSIRKDELTVVKTFQTPPEGVTRVMDGVLIIQQLPIAKKIVMNEKEFKNSKGTRKLMLASWKEAKDMMNNIKFMSQLTGFNKETLNDETCELLEPYQQQPDFNEKEMGSKSSAAAKLCKWVNCMTNYYNIAKNVAPKQERVRISEISLRKKMKQLGEAKEDLRLKQAELDKMKAKLDQAMLEKKRLEDDAMETKRRMEAAEALIKGLGGERERWTQDSKMFDMRIQKLIGDVALAATFLSYAGPFNQEFRQKIIASLALEGMKEKTIPYSDDIDAVKFLINPTVIGEWILQGLPNDDYSSQNGLIVTKGTRYPLLIDPQGQGKSWIKNKEGAALKVTNLNSDSMKNDIEQALNMGLPVLIEDIGEELDPVLDSVLEMRFTKTGKNPKIRFGDNEINFTKGFKLYITTKLANPRYTPELYAKTSIIDFTVTATGLEDQLLGIVIVKEMAELEETRKNLMEEIQNCKQVMENCENDLLDKLSENTGKNLLDDDELIDILAKTKKRSKMMKEKLAGSEETEKNIITAREQFRPVAARGSVMYFVITELSLINVMYQVSLRQFIKLFVESIDQSPADRSTSKRIDNIINYSTYSIFRYVRRGLYEKDKIIYALLLALKIDLKAEKITPKEFSTMLRAGAAHHINDVRRKPFTWLPDAAWVHLYSLTEIPKFKALLHQIEGNEEEWKNLYDSKIPETENIPDGYQLDSFQRLLLIRCYRLDRTMKACASYIIETLDERFVNSDPLNLRETWKETDSLTPIICLLSQGSDLTTSIESLAQENKISIERISMGQGQERKAQELVQAAIESGGWVLLQNCHLGIKYLGQLQDELIDLAGEENYDKSFRIWITTEPTPRFPINLLQMSIKVTDDPPTGVRAGLLKSYSRITQERLDQIETMEWKKLLFSTCFLHSTLIERKKFGPLGWCVPYEFNQSDLDCALAFLFKYLYETDSKKIQWSTVRYMICEVQYGGRVTDTYDSVLLECYGKKFYNQQLLTTKDYQLHTGYTIPETSRLESINTHIEALDLFDPPEVFGLHSNAEIAFNNTTASNVLETIMNIQPKESSGGSGETREDIVLNIAKSHLEKLPDNFNDVWVKKQIIKHDKENSGMGPMSIFLRQEIDRMQTVLSLIRKTLTELKLAIAGTIIMSSDLQDALNALFDAQVPIKWKKVSWESPTLGYWFSDVLQRYEQYMDWLENGTPKCFWISGFFNTLGFLTAVKQQSTRKHVGWSLEGVKLKTEVTKKDHKDQVQITEDTDGVFIHGLFLEGAAWSKTHNKLIDSAPKALANKLPIIHITAINAVQGNDMNTNYTCPVYALPRRTALNYIFDLTLKTDEEVSKWTLRGVAALCSKY